MLNMILGLPAYRDIPIVLSSFFAPYLLLHQLRTKSHLFFFSSVVRIGSLHTRYWSLLSNILYMETRYKIQTRWAVMDLRTDRRIWASNQTQLAQLDCSVWARNDKIDSPLSSPIVVKDKTTNIFVEHLPWDACPQSWVRATSQIFDWIAELFWLRQITLIRWW